MIGITKRNGEFNRVKSGNYNQEEAERIAQASVELLLGCIEKKQPARTLMLEAELVFGESVAERK